VRWFVTTRCAPHWTNLLDSPFSAKATKKTKQKKGKAKKHKGTQVKLLSVKAKKLQLEIGLLDKKCKEARKLADKLTAKKAALGKAEERLEAIAPGAMPPTKKKISKKKSSKGIVDAVPAKKKTSPRRKWRLVRCRIVKYE
jgi:hypothetical protein